MDGGISQGEKRLFLAAEKSSKESRFRLFCGALALAGVRGRLIGRKTFSDFGRHIMQAIVKRCLGGRGMQDVVAWRDDETTFGWSFAGFEMDFATNEATLIAERFNWAEDDRIGTFG